MTLSRPRDLQPRIRPAPAVAPAHQDIRRYIESRPPGVKSGPVADVSIDRRPLRGPDTLLRSRAIDRRPLRGQSCVMADGIYRPETPPGSSAGLVAVGLPFPNSLVASYHLIGVSATMDPPAYFPTDCDPTRKCTTGRLDQPPVPPTLPTAQHWRKRPGTSSFAGRQVKSGDESPHSK